MEADIFILAAGFGLLYVGGEAVVSGAAAIARREAATIAFSQPGRAASHAAGDAPRSSGIIAGAMAGRLCTSGL